MASVQHLHKLHAIQLTPAQWLRVGVCVLFPLGVFGLTNLVADAAQLRPLFFSPFGMPGALGAVLHLMQLSCLGAAYGALTYTAPRTSAATWLMITAGAYIALPFLTPFFDALQLTLMATGLFLLTLATLMRVAAVSRSAAWFIAPAISMLGLSMLMGLIMAASYIPPFAPLYASTSTWH